MEVIKQVQELAKSAFNYQLSAQQIGQLQKYEEILKRENALYNLTALVEHDQIWFRHFLDSMIISMAIAPIPGQTLIDIGSGGGFPGIIIKILFPDLQITLLDATAKKVNFLAMLIKELGLTKIEALQGRAEEIAHLPNFREQFDYVTTRAVAPFGTCLELMSGLVKVQGSLYLYRGPLAQLEASKAMAIIKQQGLQSSGLFSFSNPFNQMEAKLLVYTKIKKLDKNYPRKYSVIKRSNQI